LSAFTYYPLSSNMVDLFVKKSSGALSFGGEVSWLTGSAAPSGDLNALALTANAAYDFSKVKTYFDVLYASGDANPGSHMNGFVLLHRNRSPGLILGRELLGPYASTVTGQGNPGYYGDNGTFSGVLSFRPGLRIDWSTSWTTGLEVLIARKAVTTASDNASLGVEIDANVTHAVYKNFNIGLDLGYLFPGNGLRVVNPKAPFAARGTLSLKF